MPNKSSTNHHALIRSRDKHLEISTLNLVKGRKVLIIDHQVELKPLDSKTNEVNEAGMGIILLFLFSFEAEAVWRRFLIISGDGKALPTIILFPSERTQLRVDKSFLNAGLLSKL